MVRFFMAKCQHRLEVPRVVPHSPLYVDEFQVPCVHWNGYNLNPGHSVPSPIWPVYPSIGNCLFCPSLDGGRVEAGYYLNRVSISQFLVLRFDKDADTG